MAVKAPHRKYVASSGEHSNPYTLTEAGYTHVENLAQDGLPLLQIAKALNISPSAFVALRKRDPRAQAALDVGRSGLEHELVNVLIEKARKGDTVALLFSLKTLFGYREGEARTPTSVTNNTQVNIAIPPSMTPEELRALMDGTSKLLPSPEDEAVVLGPEDVDA